MGNLEQSVSKKLFFNEKALQTRLKTVKPILVINSLLNINHFSEGALDKFEIQDRENLHYSILDLSQPVQRLYSSKSRSCVEILIKYLQKDLDSDFIWEAKTIKGGYLWFSMKVQPIWSETQECLFILDLFQISEPVELLGSLNEIETLTSMIQFFSDKKNVTNEEMLGTHVDQMESLIENKTKKNTDLKEEFQRMKKEINRLKKEKKQTQKEQKKMKKKEKNNKKQKDQENGKKKSVNKEQEQKEEFGEKIIQNLKQQLKKLRFQKEQVYRQDNSQTFIRNINILKSKENVQNDDKQALHKEIEKEELEIKNLQLQLEKKEKEIEKIGDSEEFKEQNKKIKKIEKKKLKLQKEYDRIKEKVKSIQLDQELKKELDSISIQLQKKKQTNNQLRLKIATLKNNPQSKLNRSESSISEQSELDFGSDFGSEDDSTKTKTSNYLESEELSSSSTNTNSNNNSSVNNSNNNGGNTNQNINSKSENKDVKSIEFIKKQKNLPNWIINNTLPTFDDIFQHPTAFEFYKEFLSYQYNVEPLLFYLEVSNFKEYYLRTIHKLNLKQNNNDKENENENENENEDKLSLKYRYRYLNAWIFDIIKIFIKPDSIFELDLDVELRAQVIKSAIEKDDVNIFDQIQEKVYNDLSGEIFELFKNSQLFSELRIYLTNQKQKTNNLSVRKGTFVYNERSLKTLNSSINYEGEQIKHPCKFVESLMESLIDMINSSYSISNEQIDCEKLRQSVSFRRFEFATCKLQSLNLEILIELSHSKKLAFMINLFNIITLYSMIINGPPYDRFSYQSFLNNSMFDIGGKAHSLSDILHILLPNSNTSEQPSFQIISINSKDPRVHCALINPEGLVPFVKVFYSDHMNQQLNAAALGFIKRNILFSEKSKTVLIPRLFKYYSADFGNSIKTMKDWIWKYGKIQLPKKKYSLKVVKNPKFTGIISFTPKYDFDD
ncbi:electron carrier/ protein disulfide oxidoreductase [Anaeramoeba flamelloides]|uniref:Electron carrier/ protein disulfide oxidoreductase n=1 Tax=Anaeramoeba flamelloides TaxID=1746091 RepID=A0ABQ8YXA8_9EUKA|nr:electron carrier/ protein disulfide oxidoreductase [Anaeramoeba flamelloides]